MKRFFAHWLTGFDRALRRIDPAARSAILEECGRACADSCTAARFIDAKARSRDAATFASNLTASFSDAGFDLLGPRTIRARYETCSCDLVTDGPVRSPHLCECSAFNLKENVERALGVLATVSIVGTLLRGDDRCELLVEWSEDPQW